MRSREEKIYGFIGHIIMILLSMMAIFPIALMVIASFTENNTLIREGYSFLPKEWSTYAYSWLMTSNGGMVIRAYGISFVLTAIGVILGLTITTLLAYGLSRKDLPFRKTLTFYVFFTMLFNGGLVPTYMIYTNIFHVKDTFAALLIPGLLMNGFNVLLMKSYFVSSIPSEITEAAMVDGAGEVKVLLDIVLPMAKPIITTIGLFVGIAYWNDWNNGYIYLVKRTDLFSIQNLLNRLMQNIQALATNAYSMNNTAQGLSQIPTGAVRMAMATLGILPVVIIYPFIQKNFVKGITLGGVKG